MNDATIAQTIIARTVKRNIRRLLERMNDSIDFIVAFFAENDSGISCGEDLSMCIYDFRKMFREYTRQKGFTRSLPSSDVLKFVLQQIVPGITIHQNMIHGIGPRDDTSDTSDYMDDYL